MIKLPGAYLSEMILQEKAYSRGLTQRDLLCTMSYITFCTLELLSPRDLTDTKHILNVDEGKVPQNPIQTAKEYQIFFTRHWLKRKIFRKNFELNVDRDASTGRSYEDNCQVNN